MWVGADCGTVAVRGVNFEITWRHIFIAILIVTMTRCTWIGTAHAQNN